MLRAVFRADGAEHMGGGHVMRCLNLANALAARGAKCHFISRHLTDALSSRVRSSGHALTILPLRPIERDQAFSSPSHADWLGTTWRKDAEDTLAALENDCDWLIVDHYALDARWHTALRAKAKCILVIDDLADRPLDCDALLDPNYRSLGDDPFAACVPSVCKRFSSPTMALLEPAFAAAHARARVRVNVGHTFVYLGAATADQHLPLIEALAETDIQTDIVGSIAVVTDKRVIDHTALSDGKIRLHGPQPSLLPFIELADFAVAPVGTSTWERCALGLPTLAVTIASNQEKIAADLAQDQMIDLLGAIEDLSAKHYAEGLRRMQQRSWLEHLSVACLTVCDGGGVHRMVEFLLSYDASRGVPDSTLSAPLALRGAVYDDARLLYEWRNDPTTRKMSIHQDPIEWLDHLSWFARALGDPRKTILMATDPRSGEIVGTIRLEEAERERSGEISFSVGPRFRGKGYGHSLLTAGVYAFREAGYQSLIARVLVNNPGSQACFRKAGFHLVGCNASTLTFQHEVDFS